MRCRDRFDIIFRRKKSGFLAAILKIGTACKSAGPIAGDALDQQKPEVFVVKTFSAVNVLRVVQCPLSKGWRSFLPLAGVGMAQGVTDSGAMRWSPRAGR